MMRPVLLDVNALIAMFDDAHIHFEPMHAWLKGLGTRGWRTCPFTENGLLRIMGNPNYLNGQIPLAELAQKLETSKRAVSGFTFWSANFSMSEWLNSAGILIPTGKLTDAYLLKLAAANGGALATFDEGITPGLIGETNDALIEHIPW